MFRILTRSVLVATMLAGVFAGVAAAQGVQTATLQGRVVDTGGLVLPGVTVTATSPALQGPRSTVTDGNGVYLLRGLPPGQYSVTFELSGLKTVTQTAMLDLGLASAVNATMEVGGVTETVTVTSDVISSPVVSPTGGANYTFTELNALPQGRTLAAIAQLAPGLTSNTPNVGQVTISGAFAYDNVFLVDGVDINDNLFGTANNLFIEEAIAETQILTSGVSAEYGRFSGGVINAVSKSGGNMFSGSFRTNLTNDKWTTRSPYEIDRNITRADKVNTVYEGTFGGPIMKDRLWFFAAGRKVASSNTEPLPRSGVNFETTNDEKRGELKFTGTLSQNHTMTGSYFRNSRSVNRVPFRFTIDPNIPESPSFPNDRWVGSYRGVLGSRAFVDLRYSQKKFGFRGSGGSDTNIVNSPFITLTQTLSHFNGNYFDATDPEDRNNKQLAGSVSYFLTTGSLGSHDLKSGFEVYQGNRTGGNSQTATGFVFIADYLAGAGDVPVLDANGRLIPRFVTGASQAQNWLPTRGANLDIRTTSVYLQDHWQATQHLTLDVGTRFEMVKSDATGDIVGVDASSIVPRLAATFDPKANGRLVLQATYAHYAGKYSEAQFGRNTAVGNPSLLSSIYRGPTGQGRDFAPGFDPANYEIFNGSFPTANIFFDDNIKSPLTKEFTTSVGSQLGRGYVKAIYTQRSVNNFVEDFITRAEGTTTVTREGRSFGTFDNVVFRNSDEPVRDYQGLQFITRYPLWKGIVANAHWTMQLKNDGNFQGEGTNSPSISSLVGDRPELYNKDRHFPEGRLNDFQRHKVRAWATYGLNLGFLGRADLSPLYRYDSATTFSYFATGVALTDIQRAAGQAAGYARLPSTQTLFFGERGRGKFDGAHLLDLALNYQIPIFKTIGPFLKVDVFNVLNNDTLTSFDVNVNVDPNSSRDALGLPTGFIERPSFGTATGNGNYPEQRRYQFAFGVRW
ncbi:MAG TPA: TonB-dependent receptor [Vicinamibacterales bacterium]|nr:TonB-dependent receptor [Vicinamibacterales bacterium]